MKRLAPHWQILAALVLATLMAMGLRLLLENSSDGSPLPGWVKGLLNACAFVGDLFMRALKMIIVPLIVTSVIAGIASLQGVKGFGRLGLKTATFYLSTSLLSILLGLLLVNTIRPGLTDGQPNAVIREAFQQTAANAAPAVRDKVAVASGRQAGDILEVFRSMLPENVIQAATDNGQMLGVITFSILFAVAITRLPANEMRTIREFFQAANDAMIILTRWVMALAPIGVFALILPVVMATGAE